MSKVNKDEELDIELKNIVEDGVDVLKIEGLDGGIEIEVGWKIERLMKIKKSKKDGEEKS